MQSRAEKRPPTAPYMTGGFPPHHASATTDDAPPPSWGKGAVDHSPVLVVVHSPDSDARMRVIPLAQELVVVGRDVDSAVSCIRDGQLSRIHFRVAFDVRTQSHRIGDGGSRNGTLVDGERVETRPLSPGAVVRAGETVFVYADSDPTAELHQRLNRLADSDLTVLLVGETGSGKERLARAVHEGSGRTGTFVPINCASMPKELLAAELFGHTRSAFSGAQGPRLGLFQSANRGTLFLDEIGDLPLDVQGVLLRALQERSVRPVGADQEVPVDVRVVTATHVDLESAVSQGRFRADLYSRLAQVTLSVAPLRRRRKEVLSLAEHFARETGITWQASADAAEALVRHDWPFNVRELESLVRVFLASEGTSPLSVAYLKRHHPALLARFRTGEDGASSRKESPRHDRAAFEALLAKHGGNVSAAAAELGKPRAQIYRWLRAFGLVPERFRPRG